jgi:hypothetical protein
MEGTSVKQAAADAASQSRSFISSQLDDRTTEIGTNLSSTASELRRFAEDLRANQTVPGSADIALRGADAIDRLGAYLKDADGDRLIADAEAFARDRPWTIALAALTTGFALSRLLKASSSRRYRSGEHYSYYAE